MYPAAERAPDDAAEHDGVRVTCELLWPLIHDRAARASDHAPGSAGERPWVMAADLGRSAFAQWRFSPESLTPFDWSDVLLAALGVD